MAGPIPHSEDVPRASRPTSPAVNDMEGNALISPPSSIVEDRDPHYFLPPGEHRVAEESPKGVPQRSQPQEGAPSAKVQVSSAPAELQDSHHRLTPPTQATGPGPPRANIPSKSLPFELDADAPYTAVRDTHHQSIHQAAHPTVAAPSVPTVPEEPTKYPEEGGLAEEWGLPFRVDWIRTERLSFFRTKHLRNPWNHGREVKISRDGTEIEPSIGQQLLEEWDRRPPSPADIPASSRIAQRRRGSKST
jgi:hypothetical protein